MRFCHEEYDPKNKRIFPKIFTTPTNTMTTLHLTAQEIVSLLMEMPIEKGNLRICSNSSFLSILALLEQKMTKDSYKEIYCEE